MSKAMAWLALYFSILTDAITVKFFAREHAVGARSVGLARYTDCTEVSWPEKIRHSIWRRDTSGNADTALKLKIYPTNPRHDVILGKPHILRCDNKGYGPGIIDVYECPKMSSMRAGNLKKSRIGNEEVWTFTGCREGTRPMGEFRGEPPYSRGYDNRGFTPLLDDADEDL